jgi:hypothetical protein
MRLRKDAMVRGIRRLTGVLENEDRAECRRDSYLTAEHAVDLLEKIVQARKHFLAAEAKRKEFGL